MQLSDIPFGITDWSTIEPVVHAGATGSAVWRTCQFGAIRVRMVEYSESYLADHWCSKGHILLCLDGRLDTELVDGRVFTLTAGRHELPSGRQCRGPQILYRDWRQIVHRGLRLVSRPQPGRPRHKKTASRGGFFGLQPTRRRPGRYSLVPRGRLELPLLSETDFESAASTGSATGAMAAEYRDAGRPGQSKVRW